MLRKPHVQARRHLERAVTIEIESDGTITAINDVETSDGKVRNPIVGDDDEPTAPHAVNAVLECLAAELGEDPAFLHGLAPRDVDHLRNLLTYVLGCPEKTRPVVVCRALMNVLRHFGENAYLNMGARKYLASQAKRYEMAASGR